MSDALFSLVAGEGDGAILGLAAGDTAGGSWELGYSAITEQATVISYELIEHGEVDADRLAKSLLEMDGSQDEEPVFRSETPDFRHWLDRASTGSITPDDTPSLDPLGRSGPLGLTYRRQPEDLFQQVLALNGLFHTDAASLLGGVIVAAAVGASCFGQVGRDLIRGVAETVGPTVDEMKARSRSVTSLDAVADAASRVESLVDHYGTRSAADALEMVTSDNDAEANPLEIAMAALLIAAPIAERSHEPVAEAVVLAGSNGGAAVGAILGARVGIKAWPWAFPNDTWFAEIGRRLVRGPQEVADLPIPYAVEQHLISGLRQDQV